MWDDFVPTNHAFEIEQGPEEMLNNAQQKFEHKIGTFGVWDGHETMADSDEDMVVVEDAWNEAENEDILTEILQNSGQSKTYQLNSNLHGILF